MVTATAWGHRDSPLTPRYRQLPALRSRFEITSGASLEGTQIQLALVTERGFSFPEARQTIIVGIDTADTFLHFELERQHE